MYATPATPRARTACESPQRSVAATHIETILTHSEAIVCERGSGFVLLVQFLFAADGVLHEIHRLWGRLAVHQSTASPPHRLTMNNPNQTLRRRGSWTKTRGQRRRLNTDQRGYDHVEVPQVHILGTAELRCKHRHQLLEVLRALGRVAGQIPQHGVQDTGNDPTCQVLFYSWGALCRGKSGNVLKAS